MNEKNKLYSKKEQMKWKEAIIEAIRKCGGIATLKELYQIVPLIKNVPPDTKTFHIIRGFLTRMSRYTQEIKRIGLGSYALLDVKIETTIEKLKKEKGRELVFEEISEKELHSSIEGMLLELGNMYGYETYTSDTFGIFNGKPLKAFASLEELPQFTSSRLMKVVKQIDIIWLKKRPLVTIPKHAFEVEKTTNFINALNRFYQLRDFQTEFYVISSSKRIGQFEGKLRLDPYKEIAGQIHFRYFEDIFSLYKIALRHFELKEKVIIERQE